MTVPVRASASQILRELLAEDLSKGQIHVYSAYPHKVPAMAVSVDRYRSATGSIVVGATAGAGVGALVGLPLLELGAVGIAPLLVLTLAAAAGGAIFRLWIGNGEGRMLYHLDDALQRGETVMVLDVEEASVPRIKEMLHSRHPEVSVTSRDSNGLAPFG